MFFYLVQNYYFGLKEWEATNNGRRIAELVSENITGGNLKSNEINKDNEKIETIARSSNMDIGLMNANGDMVLNAPTIKDFNLTLEKSEINYVLEGNTYTKKIMGIEYRNLLMVIPLIETDNKDIILMEPQQQTIQTNLVGAIIIQTPLGGITATINNIIRLVIYSFLVAILAAIILSISFTKRVTRPLEEIQNSALKSIEGEFHEVVISKNTSEEIKHLISTFNYAVKQINITMDKQKNLEQMRKEFVANVSHEFRAPLTSIKGFLEIINDQNLSQEEINDCIGIMYKDTEYLEHLLSDLLTLGKLESDNISLNKEYVLPDHLVYRALKSLQNKLDDKQITINRKFDEKLSPIYIDSNRIHQVLINLLENAINYSPTGGIITISIQYINSNENSDSDTSIKFSITDQGPGISRQEIDKIWQRFYKVDRARKREYKRGSGLGLAIVRDIIIKHGGYVKVESVVNEGSTFSFVL
ncbi:MAG: sensor histidine kinase [Bacillota bacterium]